MLFYLNGVVLYLHSFKNNGIAGISGGQKCES